MKRVVLAHVGLLALALVFPVSAPSADDGDADDKAIRDLAGRFFDAYAAKDVDAVMALWSKKSPAYEARRKNFAGVFAETGPTELKSLAVVRVRRNGDAASVRVSRELCGERGLFGAFCLETIVTPESEFFLMEISARIVAGTNLFIDGSPYSYLNYDEPMSTGRRIARELRNALLSNSLDLVLDQSSRIQFDRSAASNGESVAVPGPGVPAN